MTQSEQVKLLTIADRKLLTRLREGGEVFPIDDDWSIVIGLGVRGQFQSCTVKKLTQMGLIAYGRITVSGRQLTIAL